MKTIRFIKYLKNSSRGTEKEGLLTIKHTVDPNLYFYFRRIYHTYSLTLQSFLLRDTPSFQRALPPRDDALIVLALSYMRRIVLITVLNYPVI